MAEKEYIEREAAIKARGRSCDMDCSKCDFAIEGDSWCDGEVFVVDLLRIPAADVRPVVLCRDCKHSEPWYADKSRCFLWHESGIDVFNDGFCNYGEKKEET